MTAERRQIIETMLRETGAVTLSELSVRFDVSMSTVRRDLDELERRGLALRTHGGAVRPRAAAPSRLPADTLELDGHAKTLLADAAYAMLRGGETIFLDASTTGRNTASYVGPLSVQSISEHFVDKAFIGDSGVEPTAC